MFMSVCVDECVCVDVRVYECACSCVFMRVYECVHKCVCSS